MASAERKYIPGVCNLGQAETRVRLLTGAAGLLLTVVAAVGFMLGEVPPLVRLTVFLPAMMGSLGFLQAYWHFCVAYGVFGIFNVSTSLGKSDTVEQAEFRTKDRKTALLIIGLSVLIAAGVTAVIYAMPA